MSKTVSITITGKVQGVFFRKYTKEKADQLGIMGTVSNQPDGSVQITATGTREQLDEFIKWCHLGSPKSKVESVDFQMMPFIFFDRFSIK